MDVDFLDVNNSGGKKGLFIFFLIIILLGAGGYYYIFYVNMLNLKTITLEVNSELSSNVNDYLKNRVNNASKYDLDISKVDNKVVGEYSYTVTFNGKTKTGKVNVVDTTPPEFTLIPLNIVKGEEYFLGYALGSCSDNSNVCLVSLKDDKDSEKLDQIGNYNLKVYVEDAYGNKKEATAEIHVVDKDSLIDEKSLDLEYSYASIKLDDFTDQYYLKLEKGVDNDTSEALANITNVSAIDWESYAKTNYPSYKFKDSEIIEIYNKSDYLIGIAVRLVFENTKIYVKEQVSSE